jgi:protein-S-isoprenylcysteine O-methyltransferase Ste14
MNKKQQTGKIIYGVLFLLIIPIVQWWWAALLNKIIKLPALRSTTTGIIIAAAGFILIAWGMISLMKFGKGLPMNAYPPVYFVKKGPYSFLRHPIYWGYAMLMVGIFISVGSGAGLWVVTPISILAMMAIVTGYEKIDLEERFKGTDMSVLLDLPSLDDKPLTTIQRLASLFWVFTFFLIANSIVWFLTNTSTSVWNASPGLDIFKDLDGIQSLSLPFILSVPLIIKNRNLLRRWNISVLLAIALSSYIALLWPAVAAQYFYYSNDSMAVLLSVPVCLNFLTAAGYGRQFKKGKLVIIFFAALITLIQLSFTKAFYPDLIVAVFIFLLADNYRAVWLFIRQTTETIANSWQEWRVGRIRIINRGIYIAIAGFGGILFCGLLVGKDYAWAILLFAVITTISAAIWAQLIEGSEKLKRPFGFYGAIVGIIFASLMVWILGYDVWILIGIISVVMPWVQAVGRFGCLINGCCHGKPTENSDIGIRYYHQRSRVCNISGLKGKFLHPTQVYSMLWLFFVGFLLLACWIDHLPYSFIFGIYLVLTGIGRFVEEAYRGEVQTPIWNGLRLYQWAAIASVIIGIIFTVINIQSVTIQPEYGWEIWVAALIGGFFTFFAMSVDFPYSNARFSRLV